MIAQRRIDEVIRELDRHRIMRKQLNRFQYREGSEGFGHEIELDHEVARQVLRLELAAFFLPQADQGEPPRVCSTPIGSRPTKPAANRVAPDLRHVQGLCRGRRRFLAGGICAATIKTASNAHALRNSVHRFVR
jgi:hypothetical protein